MRFKTISILFLILIMNVSANGKIPVLYLYGHNVYDVSSCEYNKNCLYNNTINEKEDKANSSNIFMYVGGIFTFIAVGIVLVWLFIQKITNYMGYKY